MNVTCERCGSRFEPKLKQRPLKGGGAERRFRCPWCAEVYESDEIARIAQEISEALRPVCEAVQVFIEHMREMCVRIAEIARAHLAHLVRRLQVFVVYKRLRSWHIPHMLAVIVAYLWVVKRWPPHTVVSG